MLQYVQNTFVMDRDKLKLLIRQLEFTLDAIKAEVYSDTDAYIIGRKWADSERIRSSLCTKFFLV